MEDRIREEVSSFEFRVSRDSPVPKLETFNPKRFKRQKPPEIALLTTFALITLNLNYIFKMVPGFRFLVWFRFPA